MFDPVEFFNLASQLCSPSAAEAHLRTSIGRCYYASFLTTRERLATYGHYRPLETGADHQGVIDTLARLGRRPLRDKLDSLRQLRTRADYDLQSPVGFKETERAKRLAQNLLRETSQIT